MGQIASCSTKNFVKKVKNRGKLWIKAKLVIKERLEYFNNPNKEQLQQTTSLTVLPNP